MDEVIILDGPLGTELERRGVVTRLPRWSADAMDSAPQRVADIHRDYADAGARVHTTNTFRTRRRTMGAAFDEAARAAVRLAREAVPAGHRVAGSIAPLEDCYRPDRSPENPGPEHAEFAKLLASAGCDLLLCETFSHPGEALIAVTEALETGLETWLALCPGPDGTLMEPSVLLETAHRATELGVSTVLANCVSIPALEPFVERFEDSGLRFGVYANAGRPDDEIGWRPPRGEEGEGPSAGALRYAEAAIRWRAAGASVIGGCCGTGPEHIRAVADAVA